jgi:hypothetical protein
VSPTGCALPRRTVLRGLGLVALSAGGAAVTGCDSTDPDPPGPTGSPEEDDIMDLSFRTVEQFRPYDIVAPGFEQVEEVAPQALTQVRRSGAVPVAPFAAVELTVDELGPGGVTAGLWTASGDHVAAAYDPAKGRVTIEVHRDGRTTVVRRRKVSLQAPFRFAFVLCENQVTALADDGGGWRALCTQRERVAALVDLRVPGILAEHAFGWGPRRAGDAARVSGVRAGVFGKTGLRDLHLVQHTDGRPYVRDGLHVLTATCAGMGFFQQAHWGVFTMDLARPDSLTQVGQLFFERDGLLLGDHAGQVVVDEAASRCIVATSSWGDFDFDGVHVRHTTAALDVLEGVHVLATEPTALPTEVSAWDPGLTLIDGRWHVCFVESPSQDPFDFHPALAIGPAGGGGVDAATDGLELVGADTDVVQCEGPILQQVEGTWWLLASDSDVQEYRVYDLDMTLTGTLDAPYGTNIPHAQLVQRDDGTWLMITFDGTQHAEKVLGYGGHGDVLVMASEGAT